MNKIEKEDIQENNFSLQVLKILWKDKYIFAIIILFSIGIGVYYLKKTTYLYSVYLNVLPTSNSVVKGQDSGSGIASIIGIAIGNNSRSTDFDLYKSLIVSELSANELINDQDATKRLFASEFDQNTGEWIEPKSTFNSKLINGIKRLLGVRVYPPSSPNFERVFNFIVSEIMVSTDRDKGITKIEMLTDEPELGAFLISRLHEMTDNLLRKRALNKAEQNIIYLVKELEATYQKDLRLSLIKTLSFQQQNIMSASADLPFSAEKLGDINISPKPVYPRARSVLAISVITGFFFSCFISILKFQLLKK